MNVRTSIHQALVGSGYSLRLSKITKTQADYKIVAILVILRMASCAIHDHGEDGRNQNNELEQNNPLF